MTSLIMFRRTGVIAAVAAIGLMLAGCNKGGAGLDNPIDPTKPPAGLETAQRTLRDGAGNAGPIKVRLQTVRPELGSQVVGSVPSADSKCNQSSPWSCFEYDLEVCIDPIPNPSNLGVLSNLRFDTVFSSDGTNPVFRTGFFGLGDSAVMAPGTCKSVTTPLNMKKPFPTEGAPRYFMVIAAYGVSFDFFINSQACPTPEEITANRPPGAIQCSFKTVYDLGYHY